MVGEACLPGIIASIIVSHVINSRALTGEKPCINKAIQALLMHGYATFNMIVPGPQIFLPLRDVYCPALEQAQFVEIMFARHR